MKILKEREKIWFDEEEVKPGFNWIHVAGLLTAAALLWAAWWKGI